MSTFDGGKDKKDSVKNGLTGSAGRNTAGRVRMRRGFGSIRYLGSGRRNAFAVHPPAVRMVVDGKVRYVRQKAICYVADWFVGFAMLTAWHAKLYQPGMEEMMPGPVQSTAEPVGGVPEEFFRTPESREAWEAYCRRLQQYLLRAAESREEAEALPHRALTLKEVYERFYESKFGALAPKRLAGATADNARSVFARLAPLHDRLMDDLSIDDLQGFVNGISLGRTMVSKCVTMIKELYRFGISRDLCTRNPSQYLVMPDREDYVHHQDFTDEELAILWRHGEDPMVRMILVMCYSGFRVSAFDTLETNLEQRYFRGGVKTEAGKDRIVPIHSAIFPFVQELTERRQPWLCGLSKSWFCRKMGLVLEELGIDGNGRHHTPHSCRHTFSRLCESFGVREADRKRLMGHSFGNDITNGVYGHRSLAELRAEVEKIQVDHGGVLYCDFWMQG